MPRQIIPSATLKTVQKNAFGTLGLPIGTKETGQRADFRPDIFEINIEAKGQRLAWSRASHCPCVPISDQTQQPDPNCSLCGGNAVLYFGPQTPQDLSREGLADVQKLIFAQYEAFMIRGLLLSSGKNDRPWDRLGPWRSGTAMVTVRAQNQIGFMDRLINLDGLIAFSEILEMPQDNLAPLKTRYLVSGGVQLVRSTRRRYQLGRDFFVQQGRIVFVPASAPVPKERLSLHYVTFPTWLVGDMPHATRITNVSFKNPQPISPEGDVYAMPIQAALRLEFLPSPTSAENAP
jgi:hypothetical protein